MSALKKFVYLKFILIAVLIRSYGNLSMIPSHCFATSCSTP